MPGQAAGDNPGFIAPMLATAAAGLPPDAAEFVAEVNWDGLRACVAVSGGRSGPDPGAAATSPPSIPSSAVLFNRQSRGAGALSWASQYSS
ncbi:MAG TPA: hypothetical protein VHS32_25385 [Streptosporangiaceae bacterium]|jgi:hypothetical protein|nr:hypothetical protein [Streptosporangiaceae bacterium]